MELRNGGVVLKSYLMNELTSEEIEGSYEVLSSIGMEKTTPGAKCLPEKHVGAFFIFM